MATVHAHPTLQAMAVEHTQGSPSSPTLTDPNLLLPNRITPSNPHRADESFRGSDTEPSLSSSTALISPFASESFEAGTARTFLVPMRPKPAPPVSNKLIFGGYEHGAPLSDIGEEEMTPKSKRARSRTPSPTASSPTIAPQSLAGWSRKSEKRLSEMSNSSSISIGSDLQWEGFDTRAGMSDRLKADLAAAGDDSFNLDGFGSKRDSSGINGDDENTSQALGKRAEQILANAKMRLTNMEGNLSRARTSLLVTTQGSPTIGEHKQVGGLYRSISQGGDRRISHGSSLRKPRSPSSPTTGSSPIHTRNLSETSVPSGSARYPKPPEVRSASAMEYGYGGQSIDSMLYEKSSPSTNGHPTASSRWQHRPLTVLPEEGSGPSTEFTPLEMPKNRGLGIGNQKHAFQSTSNDSGYGVTRSRSQTSTRELRDQVNGLKSKIEDLRTGQQAERFRRNSLQNLRSSSPVAAAEEWYAGAAEYKGGGSPLSTNAGMGWRAEKDRKDVARNSPTSPRSPQLPRSPKSPRSPSFPPDSGADNFRNGLAPQAHSGQDLHSYSSTPNPPPTSKAGQGDRDDQDSYIQESQYEDAFEGRSGEVEYTVAASEEEQIYLNEVLEESLQDAEPEVPPIPDVVQTVEPERHEDRADAFDYENFFLHSALGNYSQSGFHRRNISQGTADSRRSYESSESVETTRAPRAEENEVSSKEEPEGEEEDETRRQNEGTFWQDEPPTPSAPNPPFAQHLRSNSIDSTSSSATFATATEGGGNDSESETDSVPSEILHWGERSLPGAMVGAWPSPLATAPRGLSSLTNGHASPLGTNVLQADTEIVAPSSDALPTPPASSPLHQQQAEVAEEQENDSSTASEADDDDDDDNSSQQPSNTSILISALITLANPSFKSTGPFSEVDKDLVVNVLRSVGAVCEGINDSDARGEVYESRVWRRRLDLARRVLEGEIEVDEEQA